MRRAAGFLAGRFGDLIVQAAAERIVDFSQMKFRSLWWTPQLRFLLEYLDRRNHQQKLQLLCSEQLAYIASGRLSREHHNSAAKLVKHLTDRIFELYSPSAKLDKDREQKAAVTKIEQATVDWESEFGLSLTDKEAQEAIAAVAKGLRGLQQTTAAKAMSDTAEGVVDIIRSRSRR
jgi:hypothetical protein